MQGYIIPLSYDNALLIFNNQIAGCKRLFKSADKPVRWYKDWC